MRYDDVEADEAIDLIATLPDGALYVAAMDPSRSWSERRTLAADVVDALYWLTWALAIKHDEVPEPPRVTRPADVLRQRERAERRKRATRALRTANREEV